MERELTFTVLGTPIERIKEFKYLGRILEESDDDWPALQSNLKKARAKWGRIGRILSREQANPRVMATFYKAIIQSVLLYGAETWVLTKCMMQPLRGFHQRCARHLTGRFIKLDATTGKWIYPDRNNLKGSWLLDD